jgi:hypothetical protein
VKNALIAVNSVLATTETSEGAELGTREREEKSDTFRCARAANGICEQTSNLLYFVTAAKLFGICQQRQFKLIGCSDAQRKIWKLLTTPNGLYFVPLFLLSHAPNIFGICRTKATQINCMLFCRAAKLLQFLTKATQVKSKCES